MEKFAFEKAFTSAFMPFDSLEFRILHLEVRGNELVNLTRTMFKSQTAICWYFWENYQKIDNRHTRIMNCYSSFKDASTNGIQTSDRRGCMGALWGKKWEFYKELLLVSGHHRSELSVTFGRLLSMKIKKILEELKNHQIAFLNQFFVLLVGTLITKSNKKLFWKVILIVFKAKHMQDDMNLALDTCLEFDVYS